MTLEQILPDLPQREPSLPSALTLAPLLPSSINLFRKRHGAPTEELSLISFNSLEASTRLK